MLKVLFLTSIASVTGRENVGDRVILAGARNLIAAAFGHYVYQEHGRWGRFEGDPSEFDLIVYAGMPQYGARSAPSKEEVYFSEIIEANKRAVVMNIGGGTIHPLGRNPQFEAIKMAQSRGSKYYAEQEKRVAYRTVRDMTSKRYFDRMGVRAELRPCPSYYSTQTIRPGSPRAGAISALNNNTFVTNHFRGGIGELMAILQDRHPDFDIVSHSGSDLGLLADFNRAHLYFRSETALLSYYTTVRRLVALRIHGAIPAWTMGTNVVVGGFDNRVGMFDDVGMPIPWVNMLTESMDSIIDQLDTIVTDDSSHAPLELRRELIGNQLLRASAEVRAAAPDLVRLANDKPVALDGWVSHPPAGTVHVRENGFTLSPVPLDMPIGDEESGSEIVAVPAGTRAPAATKQQVFPLELPARKFSSQVGSVDEKAIAGSLKSSKDAFASGGTVFLPKGEYSGLVRLSFEPGTTPGQGGRIEMIVRQDGIELGRRVLDVADLATRGKLPTSSSVKFVNQYAAMPIELLIRTSGFTGTETLKFSGVKIGKSEE